MASPTCGPSFCSSAAIGGEEFDVDRLRCVRQVADHVLQHLGELDIQLRLGLLDLRMDIRHHLVDAAVALVLQLHGDVAGICFGHGGVGPSAVRCAAM